MSTAMETEVHLEGTPLDEQKERLEDFMSELMLITRRYGILLLDEHEATQIIDMGSGNLIGLGLVHWTATGDDRRVLAYEAADSILDGTWLVDTADGPVEQRLVGNVFPQRRPPQ